MRIALDVDGVIANVMGAWLRLTKRSDITMDDMTDWEFWSRYGIKKDQFHSELNDCWTEWRSLPPTEDGIGGSVRELAELGTVDILTARDPSTDKFVKMWLDHHGIGYDRYCSVASGTMKADRDYDVFIDDSPLNAARFVERGKRVILYTQPWNRDVPDAGLRRVSDLAGAIREATSLRPA